MSSDRASAGLVERVMAHIQQERWFSFARISPQLTVVEVSPNLREIFHDKEADVLGWPLAGLFDEFVGAEEALRKILRGESPRFWLEQVNWEQADGSTLYYDFQVIPLEPGQPETGLLLIVLDSTHTSCLEQQLVQDRNELRLAQAELKQVNAELHRLSDLKSIFLSIAAHDLRTPLAALRGYADLILSDPPLGHSPEHNSFLISISSLVEQMDRLVSDFLDLDQIEKGRLRVTPLPCNLNVVARESITTVKNLPESQEISLQFIPADSEVWVLADLARTQQIFYNLLSNAIKYTPAGGEVRVKTWIESGYGAFLIQDNGRGLSQHEVDHLFELYYRTQEAETSRVRGAGLGLFIVNALVKALDGQIQVSSQVGQGTTFSIRLPLFSTDQA